MKHEFVKQEGNGRLILIFAGWAMDANPFRHVSRPSYDTLIVWDYRTLDIDWSVVTRYNEIVLLAWSMGVYAASSTIHAIDHLITAKIAINGTVSPVDNHRGIPEAIFNGTASTLNDRNLQKFFRRMCGDRSTTEKFLTAAPLREVEELKDELNAIFPEPWFGNRKVLSWDRAIIGRDDAIFPACNQQRAWSGIPITVVDRPHYIDMQEIADAYVIDKDRAAELFEAGLPTYESNSPVQNDIVEKLIEDVYGLKLDRQISVPGVSCLEIGCGSGSLSRRLKAMMPKGHLHLWDTNSISPEGIADAVFKTCDAETQICRTQSNRFDVIASASTVQWFNSPSRFLTECERVLRPGGLLLLTGFVKGNMQELLTAGGVSLPLPDLRQWRAMIPVGFEVLSLDTKDYDLTFDEPTDVLRHLKLTGVNGLGRSGKAVKATALVHRYPRMLDGMCHLTYRTIRLILRKKDV